MQRSIVSGAVAVLLATTLVACGSSDDGKTDASQNSGATAGASSSERTPAGGSSSDESPRPSTAKLGGTLTLEGVPTTGTVTADVTLNRFEDPAQPAIPYFGAPNGQHLVAVQFTIVSTGDATYSDPTPPGAYLLDASGKVYSPKPGDPTFGPSFDVNINLPPGGTATGWVIFNVPQDAKITAVTFQMNRLLRYSRPQEGTGTWTLG